MPAAEVMNTLRAPQDNTCSLSKHSPADKNSFLGRILVFGARKSSPMSDEIVEVVRNVLTRSDTMKNVDGVGLGKEGFRIEAAVKDKGVNNVVRSEVKESTSVVLNRIALSKFLNDLREDVVSENVFCEVPVKDADAPERRAAVGKDRHGKGILSREFGKDGDKLKMRIIEEDVAENERVGNLKVGGKVFEEEGRKVREVCTPRKVSFKVNNKGAGGGRRNKVVESRAVLNSSKVAALASKYNSLVDNVDARTDGKTVKSSVQKQEMKVVVSRKNSALKRDNSTASVKTMTKKGCDELTVSGKNKEKRNNSSIKCKTPVLKSRSGNVKAAIQIFEQNSTIIKVRSAGSVIKDEKVGRNKAKDDTGQEKENLRTSVLEERPTSLVPRFSTLYKDYNKEFKQKVENDKCDNKSVENRSKGGSVVTKSENSANKDSCESLREGCECPSNRENNSHVSSLIENKSVLYSGQVKCDTTKPEGDNSKTKDCAVVDNGNKESAKSSERVSKAVYTARKTEDSKESQQGRVDKTEEGHYDVVQTITGVCPANTQPTSGRKISKITKKVITFPKKTKSKSLEPETQNVSADSVLSLDTKSQLGKSKIENEKLTNEVDSVKDYENINVGSSEILVRLKTAENIAESQETSTETSTNPEIYERIFPTPPNNESAPPKVRPNTSFLWGAPQTLQPPKPEPCPRPQSTLPRVPDIEIPDIYAYDDVYPPSSFEHSDSLHYSSVKIEDIYDDIGVDTQESDVIGRKASQGATTEASTEETASCRYDYVSRRPCDPPTYQDLEEEEDNIYDDVKTMSMKEDTISISNCYESIYEGVNGSTKEAVNSLYGGKEAVKYESSGGSSISSKSFCEQNNSLYGGLLGPRFESGSVSQASTASVEDGPHEVMSYQLTSLGVTRSDTSDEWVDLEPSDSEPERGTINLVVHERSRCRRSPSWSQKVRRQWSKSPRAYTGTSGGESSDDSDHHYEMLDDVVDKTASTGADLPFDDFDSFDSDSSEDHVAKSKHPEGYNTRLPDPPSVQNIYGITKIAEAAGNKLLKLRKSLSKMRPKRHTTEIRLSNTGPPPLSMVPPSPPASLEKTSSSGNLSNKKYWSLRKFKRSSSTVSQPASTFYITDTVDVDTGQAEVEQKRNSVVSESSELSNGHEATSASSSKTSMNEVGIENAARKTSKPVAMYERRTSARPNSPPPLPPPLVLNTESAPKRPNRKDKRSTSWYAECGLFDGSESNNSEVKRNANKDRAASNSWYAEVGLWDEANSASQPSSLTHDLDLNNSAEASDCSVSPENSGVERRFNDEPLYQFYTASIVELARRDSSGEFDSDGYEEIGERGIKPSSRPTAMELIQPREGLHRTLWCQIPEVISSRVLSTINPHQKKLQEAKFEIIASEASYIKSLNVLEKHFISSPEFSDETVLSKSDRRILFSNITPVKNCSKRFLAELEKCWQDNILLTGICDVIYKYATDNFSSYVKYCSNQIYRDRTLRKLKEQHGRFADVLMQLESTPGCQSLSLHSFLMLPMQRITRLPLLVDAVLTRLGAQDDEYPNCKMALATLNKIVKDCNEGARRMERMEEILILSRQLDFPREIKAVPIISSTRWLVRSGELTQLIFRGDEAKLTFGKKFSKSTLHFFLFTDLLVITKKKSEECYVVTDYCPRNMVQMSSGEGLTHLPVKFLADGGRNLMLLTMLQNHERKTVEMVLSCGVESDRQRWLQATSQPTSDNPDESVYEDWDCPQVTTVHPFTASQPDELALDISDVVNVFRKTPDGWYHGERMRDGEQGWFPGNYTVEVASAHVRARNLKQRYRLLALSANYLDSQRKEKK